jgi:DNA-binding transcriptional ArsR family regulator
MVPFRALADPTRRAVLDLLREQGPLRAGDIAGAFSEISRPAVSKHLGVLRRAGLVMESKDGRERWYALRADPLRQAHEWLGCYEAYWQGRLDVLKALAES